MAIRKKARKKAPKTPEVVKGIQDVSDLDENHVALFYGKGGRGKTALAGTFPTPNLFLDINQEKGLKTVKTIPGIQVAKINTWDDLEDLYWWLLKGQKYKTITLDQITGLQDLGMKKVREDLRMDPEDPFEGFKRWGRLSGNMKTWLENYRGLKNQYNVIFIAHERAFSGDEDAEEDDLDPSVGARVIPSVGSYVEGACDIIGQSFIRNVEARNTTKSKKKSLKKRRITKYCLRIGPHPSYVTKIRRPPDSGPLPSFIVDPTYQKLIDLEDGKPISVESKPQRKRKTLRRRT